MPDPKPYKPPYAFAVTIGENCARKMRTFQDSAEKLGMPVEDLMRQANGHTSPSKALVKGGDLGISQGLRDIHGRKREPGKAIAQGGCPLERPHTLKELQQSRASGKADDRKSGVYLLGRITIGRNSCFQGLRVPL